MNEHEKDPFEKYDKLFDEQDKKSVVQPATKKKEPSFEDSNPKSQPEFDKAKAKRILITVIFTVLFIQIVPVVIFRNTGMTMVPIFSFIFIIVMINIIIKAFKR